MGFDNKKQKMMFYFLILLLSFVILLQCATPHFDSIIERNEEVIFTLAALLPMHGNEFDNVSHLKEWLTNNPVSSNKDKTDVYDCDNFAMDLCNDAVSDGYKMKVSYSGSHAYCETVIDNIWYKIEPQTDDIEVR